MLGQQQSGTQIWRSATEKLFWSVPAQFAHWIDSFIVVIGILFGRAAIYLLLQQSKWRVR